MAISLFFLSSFFLSLVFLLFILTADPHPVSFARFLRKRISSIGSIYRVNIARFIMVWFPQLVCVCLFPFPSNSFINI